MSLAIPPGYGLAALNFSSSTGTQPFVTTIGVGLANWGGDFVDAANAVFAAYATTMLSTTDNDLTLSHVTLSVGQDGPGGSVDSDATPAPGTSTGTFAPVAMAPVIRKTTNVLGRRGRGRMFIPGVIQEAGVEPDGRLTTTFRNQLQGAVDNFFAELTTNDPSLAPYLLHSEGLGAEPTLITSLTVTPVVGWIRGRIR